MYTFKSRSTAAIIFGVLVIVGTVILWAGEPKVDEVPVSQPAAPTPSSMKSVGQPLDSSLMRITKKPFGIRVSPDNSPVSPERFTGVHTGVDFEILRGEDDVAVEVRTICDGEVLRKTWGSGYGGYVVQACKIGGVPVTVVYGHLSLESVSVRVGDIVNRGTKFALLGKGFSKDTDNERKHLHLGIHRGTSVVTNGYIANESGLEDWINVEELLR